MLAAGDSVLIGLSGGADSVCLLSLLDTLRPEFQISLHAAYIDHRMRPIETPSEIAFCRGLCDSRGVPFTTREVDVLEYVRREGLNKQEAARELRYRAFDDMAGDLGTTKLAMGHTADDQVETILMRLFRGTGPSGLAGIPPKRGHVIRPLIETERKDIEVFLDSEGISFITDSSNLRDDYLRNRIRHRILPLITTVSREAPANIVRTAEIFRDEERYFEIQVTKTLMRLISRKNPNAIDLF
ncbi:MAG TPA: tRNA lysidine(34) synthetase TilS, partial [Dissulfurispiraceae bacterium]|nr:tRNA lysidine(34) synthetase TilS [Dissulfurispiraceae bacterium]